MKKLLTLSLLFISLIGRGQEKCNWNFYVKNIQPGVCEMHVIAYLEPGWNLCSIYQPRGAVEKKPVFILRDDKVCKLLGGIEEYGIKKVRIDSVGNYINIYYSDSVEFVQKIIIKTRDKIPQDFDGAVTYELFNCKKQHTTPKIITFKLKVL